MKQSEAIKEARACFIANGIELTVYHDEIGGSEFEAEHWGFCPTRSLGIAARFRDASKDITINAKAEIGYHRDELDTYMEAIFDEAFMVTWWASHSEDEPMEVEPIAEAYREYKEGGAS